MKTYAFPLAWLVTGLLAGFLCGAVVVAAYGVLPSYDYTQVVAQAGGTTITRGELAERTLFRYGSKVLDDELRREALLKEAARRATPPVVVTDAEVDRRITDYMKLLDQYKDLAELVGSKDAFQQLPQWMLEDQFRTSLYAEKLMGINFTQKEMAQKSKEMYEKYMDRFTKPALANLTLIVCSDEMQAKRAWHRLRDGEDPRVISGQMSILKGIRDIRGELGWVARTQMSRQLAEAIFDARRGKGLKAGEFTDVIEYQWVVDQDVRNPQNRVTEANFVILYVNGIEPPKIVPMKEVQPVLDLLVRTTEVALHEREWFEKNESAIPWRRVKVLSDPQGKPEAVQPAPGARDPLMK